MKQGKEFFDEHYFEKPGADGVYRSNYTRGPGYNSLRVSGIWFDRAFWMSEILQKSPKGLKILDVGCAYGFFVNALRQVGAEAYGVDISEFAISMADEEVRPFLAVCDITVDTPEFEGVEEWDLVTTFDVLEHCETREEAGEILRRLALLAPQQFHLVNTGQDRADFGGDLSHGLAMPIEEWRALADEVATETDSSIVIHG